MKAELIETLAAIEHERWADWQKYLHSQGTEHHDTGAIVLAGERVESWERQILTPYAQLSEAEKQSDRDQVMRYWPVLVDAFATWLIEHTDDDSSSWTETHGEALARAFREEMA